MSFARRCVASAAAVIFLAAIIECQLEIAPKENGSSSPSAGSQGSSEFQSPSSNSNPSGRNAPTTFSLFDRFRAISSPEASNEVAGGRVANGENSGGSEGKSEEGNDPDFASGDGNSGATAESSEQSNESTGGGNGDDVAQSGGEHINEYSPSEASGENSTSDGGSSEAQFPAGGGDNDGAEPTQGQQKPTNIQEGDGDGSTRVDPVSNKSEENNSENGAGVQKNDDENKDTQQEGEQLVQVESQSSTNDGSNGTERERQENAGNAKDRTNGNPNDGGAFEKVESELRKEDNGNGEGSEGGDDSNNGGEGESDSADSQPGSDTEEEGSKYESGTGEPQPSGGGEFQEDIEHSVGAVDLEGPEVKGSETISGGKTENGDQEPSKEIAGPEASKAVAPPPAIKQEKSQETPTAAQSLVGENDQTEEGLVDEAKVPDEPSENDASGSSGTEKVESVVTEEGEKAQGEAVKDKPPGGENFKTLSKATEQNGDEISAAVPSSPEAGGEETEQIDGTSNGAAGLPTNGGGKKGNGTSILPPLEPEENGPVIEPFSVIVNGVNNVTVVEPPGTPSEAQLIKYATPPPGPVELEAGGSCGPERWSKNHYAHARHGMLNDGSKNITANNMQCCRLCQLNPACRSWTRVKQDQPLKKEGECWLFNHVPRRSHAEWADSGISPEHGAQGKIVCDASTFEFGFHHPSKRGVINEGHRTFAATDHDCCMKCRLRSNCRTWTRITNTTASNQFGECWMRDWVPPKQDCDHCTSGITPA